MSFGSFSLSSHLKAAFSRISKVFLSIKFVRVFLCAWMRVCVSSLFSSLSVLLWSSICKLPLSALIILICNLLLCLCIILPFFLSLFVGLCVCVLLHSLFPIPSYLREECNLILFLGKLVALIVLSFSLSLSLSLCACVCVCAAATKQCLKSFLINWLFAHTDTKS